MTESRTIVTPDERARALILVAHEIERISIERSSALLLAILPGAEKTRWNAVARVRLAISKRNGSEFEVARRQVHDLHFGQHRRPTP